MAVIGKSKEQSLRAKYGEYGASGSIRNYMRDTVVDGKNTYTTNGAQKVFNNVVVGESGSACFDTVQYNPTDKD